MAKVRKKNGSKAPMPTSKMKIESVNFKQSEAPKKPAFSDLSKKIQAQFGQLGNARPKASFKQPLEHRRIKEQDVAATSTLESASQKVQSRGKKRNSSGIVKEADNSKVAKSATAAIPDPWSVLEKEVYALGGTVEDFALVANIESESELDEVVEQEEPAGESKLEYGLQQGIVNIIKQIDQSGRPSPLESDAEEERSEGAENEKKHAGGDSSSSAPSAGDTLPFNSRLGKSNLLIVPRSDWFNVDLPPIESGDISNSRITPGHVNELHEHAKSLLNTEHEAFKARQQSSSSQSFYSTVIASGTLSDKISALTLAVQESPLHNVRALETLINLSKKRSRAQAVDVLRALKDLFAQGSLLPSDRKLHAFSSHPSLLGALSISKKSWTPGDALPGSLRASHLIVWAYESWLKEKYFEMLKTLEIWCNDEIEFSKSKAVGFVYELLKEKPEQESNLLRLLTNKLGDPSKKIASQTSYLLMQLMTVHPLMKMTIVSNIDSDLLFRPGQSLHAKYYAAITLNQTALSSKEEDVASKLLSIYFSLFVGLLKPANSGKGQADKKSWSKASRESQEKSFEKHLNGTEQGQAEDLQEKLISAILTGINRAYPYTESTSQSLPTHLEALFKITHSSNFNTSIQAMMLIQQICCSHQASADRFYRTLYESLLDARLITSSKQSLYLNLLYRALKDDTNMRRVKAFVKRILQMLALHQPSFVCGCFFLLQELRQAFPGLNGMINQAEEHDLGDEYFEDVREEDDERHLPQEPSKTSVESQAYDGRKRDPEHSNAEHSCLWEVIPFLAHFHPSVSVSAEHILRQAKLPGKPDLGLHTLIHFLDRFAYRKAKIGTSNLRGSSIMQPLAVGDTATLLVSSASHGQLPVNSERFWGREIRDVQPEDAFFHQYFNSLGRRTQERKMSKMIAKAGNDDGSDNEESEIWKAMMESAPDLEGADESDQGLEMSDLESDFEGHSEEIDGDDDDEIEDGGLGELSDEGSFSLDPSASLAQREADGRSGHHIPALVTPSGKTKEDRNQRRKMKHLPTFASASEYAKMIDDEEGEDG